MKRNHQALRKHHGYGKRTGRLSLLLVLWGSALFVGACLKIGPPDKKNPDASLYKPIETNTPHLIRNNGSAQGKTRLRPKRGGKATVHLGYEPPHLNLFLQEDFWISRLIINHVQEALVRTDGRSGKILPNLATSWTYSKKGLKLTFTLRQGVTFHDGHPFSVKDVVFTFDLLKDPQRSAASLRQDFATVSSYEAKGNTFVLNMKRPDFKLLSSLSHLPILPRHIYAATSDMKLNPASSKPVGTGPLKLKEWKRGHQIVFERYEKYWGKGALLDEITFKIVRDTNKAILLLEKGELDFIPRVPVHLACGKASPIPKKSKSLRVLSYYPMQFHSIIFNVKSPQLKDIRVRRALAALTPRKLIAKALLCSHARLITGPFWPDHPGYDGALPQVKFSPRKARHLLESAGWKDSDGDGIREKGGSKLKLTYLQISESSLQRRLCPVLKDTYRRAGIQLDMKKVPFSRWLRLMRTHQFHMADVLWTFFGKQDLYQHYHCSQSKGGSNYGSYCNPKVDTLLETIRKTLGANKRTQLQRLCHRTLYKDPPAIYLFNMAQISLAHNRLRGCKPNNEGFPWSHMWIRGKR